MARKKAEETVENVVKVEIPEIDFGFVNIEVVGDSPLIVHNWDWKVTQEMLDKQMKKATNGKNAKDPEYCFFSSLYWLNDELPENPEKKDYEKIWKSGKAKFGFKSVAFKSCAIDAAFQQGLIPKKTTVKGAFLIQGEFVEIKGTPRIREDMVMVGGMSKVADIRYRAEFPEWSATLPIKYNRKSITPEQIVSMLNIGGFSNGVGEWRMSKDGTFGCFHVKGIN